MKKSLFALLLAAVSVSAFAKLPAPSEEAAAKAAEAKAKTAHAGKVTAFQVCKSQDKVVAHVQRTNKAKVGKPVATPACADPGKFVYTPPEAAPAAAPAAAAPAKKS
jgi:hypothetical protein